jgi:2'-5' RNA ligase
VIAAGVRGDLPGVSALAAALGRGLAPLGHPPEDRPFHPHLTLGRVRDGRPPRGLGEALGAATAGPPVAGIAGEVVLVRSHLAPGGSRYEPLARCPLSAG